ncbi:hypothetical protein EMIT0196MI5_90034 [Pseudomonas sp. IT-196MI5]
MVTREKLSYVSKTIKNSLSDPHHT